MKVLATEVSISDAKTLRDFGDKLRDKLETGIILLAAKADDKALLLCMVTKDLAGKFHAGNIIKELAPIVGGKGGGRPDMAQAEEPSRRIWEHLSCTGKVAGEIKQKERFCCFRQRNYD